MTSSPPPPWGPDSLATLKHALKRQPDRQGGNSAIFRETWRGREVAIKDYRAREDGHVRALREWKALTGLWSFRVGLAPEPIAEDVSKGIIVMEWIEHHQESGAIPVPEMLHSLSRLHDLSERNESGDWDDATDAISRPRDLYVQAQARLKTIPVDPTLRGEVDDLQVLVDQGVSTSLIRSKPVPTLSPSDFGPHNMLNGADGYRIIDLEFFGWDDAHKLIADTCVHPQIPWDPQSLALFQSEAIGLYQLDEIRLQQVTAAALAKWAVIILARVNRDSQVGKGGAYESSKARAREYIRRAVACTTEGLSPNDRK